MTRQRKNLMGALGETDLEAVLGTAGAAADEATAGPLRAVLELVTGGEVPVNQMGEKKKFKGWLRATFRPRLIDLVASRLPAGLAAVVPGTGAAGTVDVDLRADPPLAEALAARVKEAVDEGHLYTRIGEMMGVDRHQVVAAHRAWNRRHGLPALEDGRGRRGDVPHGNMAPTKAMRLADAAKALYDDGLLLDQIAARLTADRGTVRSALQFAFARPGQPMPDGRNRRKTLDVKNSPKGRPA